MDKTVIDQKKQLELRCLDTTKDYVKRHVNSREKKYFNSIVPINYGEVMQAERPDYIIKTGDCTYLIEHFMVDFCYDGRAHNQSQSKLANSEIMGIYNDYHDPVIGTIRDEMMEEATKKIEHSLNRVKDLQNKYKYSDFVNGFRTIFDKHYGKIKEYMKASEGKTKIGFLIEFHREAHWLIAERNGIQERFNGQHKIFPLTKEIYDIITNAKMLDFVIISQYDEGLPGEAKDVKIYEPRNMSEALRQQKVVVYDKVGYEGINANIHLNLAR